MPKVDISKYEEGLTWITFCKEYARLHKTAYSTTSARVRKDWQAYKDLHGIVPKSAGRKAPANFELLGKDVPLGPSGKRIMSKRKVANPPQGYKMIVQYVKIEDEDEDEKEEKVVVDARIKAPPVMVGGKRVAVKAPEKKKAGLAKRKKVEFVENKSVPAADPQIQSSSEEEEEDESEEEEEITIDESEESEEESEEEEEE